MRRSALVRPVINAKIFGVCIELIILEAGQDVRTKIVT